MSTDQPDHRDAASASEGDTEETLDEIRLSTTSLRMQADEIDSWEKVDAGSEQITNALAELQTKMVDGMREIAELAERRIEHEYRLSQRDTSHSNTNDTEQNG